MDLSVLQKNYYLVPISMLIALLLTYIMDIVYDKKDKKSCYIKSSLSAGILIAFSVYVHKIIPSIEEVITAPPPF